MTFDKVHLGLVATVLNGYAFKSKEYVDEGIRVVRITNVQKGQIYDDNPKFIGIHRRDEFAKFMLSDGDILISLTGNVGRVGVIEKSMLPAVLNQRVGALKPKGNQIDPRFLFYLLNSDKFEQDAINNSKGIAQLNLSSKWIEEYPVPLPPLAEQQRIAGILDKADAIRRKRQAALDQLAELRESSIRELVGDLVSNPKQWPSKPLAELVSPERKITYGILKPGIHTPDGIPMLRIQDIRNGKLDTVNLHRVTRALSDQYKRTVLSGGEIVISLVGTIGLIARVPNVLAGANVHRNLGVIVPSPEVNAGFLYRILASKSFVGLLSRATKGGVQALLNLGALNDVQLPVPPLPIQDRLEQVNEHLDQISERHQAATEQTDDLFHCLVQRAFKGEL